MSSVTTISTMLQRLGFSAAMATYLTGTCSIDSLDEIADLDGIDEVDTTIKGVANPGGMVTTGLLHVTTEFVYQSGLLQT
jgi:hypothetical protein